MSMRVVVHISVFMLGLATMSCTTPRSVTNDYSDALKSEKTTQNSTKTLQRPETAIIFLVDGLSVPMLSRTILSAQADGLRDFFSGSLLKTSPPFRLGRASFPTLTFPNLASILTGETVSHHNITGNRVLKGSGEEVNFENVQNWSYLRSRLDTPTIFSLLSSEKLNSVNYSYPFSDSGTAAQKVNVDAAISYLEEDYFNIDTATLESLKTLLATTTTTHWPRFIFVHLIGVDALAHKYGPDDSRVDDYIRNLDLKLAEVFGLLKNAENLGHLVSSVLTADHGFQSIGQEISIKEFINKLDPTANVVADNRTAAIFLSKETTQEQKRSLAQKISILNGVKWTAFQDPDGITVYKGSKSEAHIDLKMGHCQNGNWVARFRWLDLPESPGFYCPESFDRGAALSNISFIVPVLKEYFAAKSAPAIVLVAADRAEFSGSYLGNHGGLSAEEVLVPLLSRPTIDSAGALPTSTLLRQLHLLN